ncbi:uncharacterized protein LOC130739262 [Lotus japonicus]|uniref:Protein translocase subunit SecE n=1 Tax=Lotus japonicus TaxID=34305 RepID=I3T6Z9_LOTJA|nr:uncharacterized protein LOC130739262 [Lotus japonicus]XP_057447499.1 uncharacterized protein LOC130739262 [Lotus japonicus]AFK48291.1 unknown [Lotus japonicus]
MEILSQSPVNYTGFLHQGTPFLPSKFPVRVDYYRDVSRTPQMICRRKIKQERANHICSKFVTSAARNGRHLCYDDLPQKPFLLTLIKDAFWGLKSLFEFLIEQPSQLKYVEWPSFSNTLRTATLTLVIVALLIVALSSVDSALYYLLALALRKSP